MAWRVPVIGVFVAVLLQLSKEGRRKVSDVLTERKIYTPCDEHWSVFKKVHILLNIFTHRKGDMSVIAMFGLAGYQEDWDIAVPFSHRFDHMPRGRDILLARPFLALWKAPIDDDAANARVRYNECVPIVRGRDPDYLVT